MTIRTLSELLSDIKSGLRGDKVSVGRLVDGFHERGFGFFLFLFALPAALPLPGLGINMVVALPLLLLTLQQALGRHSVWLPLFIRNKEISCERLVSAIDRIEPWLDRIEVLIRPRLEFATRGRASNITGLTGLVMALSICVPLPLTNTVPGFGIALMALGLLMRDGLAVIAGAVIGITWVSMLAAFGYAGVNYLSGMTGL